MCHGDDGIARQEWYALGQLRCAPVFERWMTEFGTNLRSTIERSTVLRVLAMVLWFHSYFRNTIDRTRVLASTSKGYVGWIPETARLGDTVALLAGAPFPFILRKRPDGYFSVVGDAYIQGIMHGEAWPADNETGSARSKSSRLRERLISLAD